MCQLHGPVHVLLLIHHKLHNVPIRILPLLGNLHLLLIVLDHLTRGLLILQLASNLDLHPVHVPLSDLSGPITLPDLPDRVPDKCEQVRELPLWDLPLGKQ